MGCCSDPKGYGRFFNERSARRIARKYRKRGLDGPSQRIAEFVRERGVEGATVLEIGGGVGEIQIELLEAGAERTVNLELSPEYDEEADKLAAEHGFVDRTERRIHDIAATPGEVEPADVVVLNRVVCCYPDYERLLAAAADHARRLLVFSYPPRNIVARILIGGSNLYLRLRRSELRTFAHPPPAMLAVLERHGLEPAYRHEGLVWRIAGLERA